LEKAIISGVTHDTSEAKATVQRVPDRPGIAARVVRPLADAGVNIDMIVQNVSEQGTTDFTFTLPKNDLPVAEPTLEGLAKARAGAWRAAAHRRDRRHRRRRQRDAAPAARARLRERPRLRVGTLGGQGRRRAYGGGGHA